MARCSVCRKEAPSMRQLTVRFRENYGFLVCRDCVWKAFKPRSMSDLELQVICVIEERVVDP